MYGRECVIYDNKICDECGDCNYCDINPDKICDNCGMCISEDYDYIGVQIDDLLVEDEDVESKECSGREDEEHHICHNGCKHEHSSKIKRG